MEFTLPYLGLEINIYLILLGLLIGGLSSTFGVGGGFLLVPALNILFGLPPKNATACSLTQMIPTSLSGLIPHWKKGNIVFKVPFVFFLGAFGGIELGIILQEFFEKIDKTVMIMGQSVPVSEIALTAGLSIVFLLQGSFLVYQSLFIKKNEDGEPGKRFLSILRKHWTPILMMKSPENLYEPFPLLSLTGVGLIGGLAIGFLGLGGGFIAVPVFIFLVGLDTKKAVGSSLFLVFIGAIWAAMRHSTDSREYIDWGVTISIILGSVIGSQIGVKINTIVKPQSIRNHFGFIILGMAFVVWIAFFLRLYLN